MSNCVHPNDNDVILNGCGEIWELGFDENDPNASFAYCKMAKRSEKHYHAQSTEYCCIVKGKGTYYVGDDVYPGSIVKILPGKIHWIESDEHVELFAVNVPGYAENDYIVAE